MKKGILILACIFISVFSWAQTQDSAQLGNAYLQAVKTNNFEAVQKLVGSPAVFRQVFGKELEDKTDEEIKGFTINAPKLKTDFETIQNAALERKISLAEITFESVKIENPWGIAMGPFAMVISIRYKDKTDELVISCVKVGESWYLSEILTSSNAFKKLAQ